MKVTAGAAERPSRADRSVGSREELHGPSGLIGTSRQIRHVRSRVERIAPTDVPVLLVGETGTGKNLCARSIDSRSGRGGSFVAVDCGALSESVIASELFGHRKGAFTGAVRERSRSARSWGASRHRDLSPKRESIDNYDYCNRIATGVM